MYFTVLTSQLNQMNCTVHINETKAVFGILTCWCVSGKRHILFCKKSLSYCNIMISLRRQTILSLLLSICNKNVRQKSIYKCYGKKTTVCFHSSPVHQ